MYTIVLFIRMSEYSEWAVVQRVQILSVCDSRDRIVVPLEEASLHSGVEAGENLVLADSIDVGRMGMSARRVSRVRRAYMVVAVLCHLYLKKSLFGSCLCCVYISRVIFFHTI